MPPSRDGVDMLRPLQVTRGVYAQLLESRDAFRVRAAQVDGRWRILDNRANQQLFRLTAVHHHADISRLLNEFVNEQLHAADCRPA